MTAARRLLKFTSLCVRMASLSAPAGASFLILSITRTAFSQIPPTTPSNPLTPEEDVVVVLPPPERFLQYGVSLTSAFVTSSGPICDQSNAPCIFGSGGGVAVRVGWRSPSPIYIGGAYELSVHDTQYLLRLGTLQQLRAEMRYSFLPQFSTQPFVGAALGGAIFGNELTANTFGITAGASGGAEWEISRALVARASLSYRILSFHSFTDSSTTFRNGGLAQLVGIDISIEARDRY